MPTEKKARKPRQPRAKQPHLPGLEPPSIPEIDAAADLYYDTMHERVQLSKEEDKIKDALIDAMLSHKQKAYTTKHGIVVNLLNLTNVKVKKAKDATYGETNGQAE